MDFTKALAPFTFMVLAVATSFWVLHTQPAQAYRQLRPVRLNQMDFLPDSEVDPFVCGHFSANDSRDAGIPHQPCYDMDGSVRFCCLSGSSKCSCPAVAGSELGCYNYEAENTLNDNTGAECGYFLPEQVSLRRQLDCSGSNCPGQDKNGHQFVNSTSELGFLVCHYECTPGYPCSSFCGGSQCVGGSYNCDYIPSYSGTALYYGASTCPDNLSGC